MFHKKSIVFFVILALLISLLPIQVFAEDTASSDKVLTEEQSKEVDVIEDENIFVREQLEDETEEALNEYEEIQGEATLKTFATASASSTDYQLAIANANGTFTYVGSPISNFADAKSTMNNNSNANAVVLDTRRTIGNQVVAMKNGVVVTTADKVGKSTLSFYMDGPELLSTYVQNRIDAFYYDSTGSTVKMGISGQVVEGISISQVELVPAIQAKQSYYTKNANGELVHYVGYYSLTTVSKDNPSGTTTRYTGSYQTITICKAPSFMSVNGKYYSVDGQHFYADNKLTNAKGTFYPYYQYLSFRSKTSYTEDDLNQYIASWNKSTSVINGKGEAFIKAQNDFGVNAALLLAFAAHESGYGTSSIAKNKNNLFGVNATDSNPYGDADTYSSVEASIYFQAEYMISRKYLDANEDSRYFGPNVGSKAEGLNVKYASDPYWGEKIAGHMYRLDKYLGNKDDNKYQLAVSKKITYAKSTSSTSASSYYKYANKAFNMPIGIPILIVSSSNGWYKIQSDMGIDNAGTAPASYATRYNYSTSKAYVAQTDYTLINSSSRNLDPADEGYFMVPKGITRLGGATKWDTPAVISDFGWEECESIVLASGNKFHDALSGTPLTTALDAPMLLTDRYNIPTSTMSTIEKYKPKTIYILGGTSVISDSVVNTLKSKGYTVKRVWGEDKYKTAVAVGNEMRKMYKSGTAFLVYGGHYPDALSIGSVASQYHQPILFTDTKTLNADTLNALKSWGIKYVKVAGGPVVISDSVIKKLKDSGFNVERIYGQDKWATNILAAKRFYPNTSGVVISTGNHYADALTGGPYAANANQPILLVKKDIVTQDVLNYIKDNRVSKVTILGGPMAVSESVRNKIYNVMAK
ncbi:MAG: cell wall-binding repeat-containing protein [Eubacteriales bacterium]